MRERRKFKMTGNRCSDIGEASSSADRGRTAATAHKHGDLFARVIVTRPCRIATMIGCDHGEVVAFQVAQKFGQSCIECLERGGVARNVATVAKNSVEVHEIGKQQS